MYIPAPLCLCTIWNALLLDFCPHGASAVSVSSQKYPVYWVENRPWVSALSLCGEMGGGNGQMHISLHGLFILWLPLVCSATLLEAYMLKTHEQINSPSKQTTADHKCTNNSYTWGQRRNHQGAHTIGPTHKAFDTAASPNQWPHDLDYWLIVLWLQSCCVCYIKTTNRRSDPSIDAFKRHF